MFAMSHPFYDETIDKSAEDASKMDGITFWSIFGALLYLWTQNRPDISTAFSMIAKFQSNPTLTDRKMIINFVWYLICTEESGIFLPYRKGDVTVLYWTDAHWDRDISNLIWRTGLLVSLNFGSVVWTFPLQTSADLSKLEAKFNALSYSMKELK